MKHVYLFLRNIVISALVPIAVAILGVAALLAVCFLAPAAVVFGWWWVWTGLPAWFNLKFSLDETDDEPAQETS